MYIYDLNKKINIWYFGAETNADRMKPIWSEPHTNVYHSHFQISFGQSLLRLTAVILSLSETITLADASVITRKEWIHNDILIQGFAANVGRIVLGCPLNGRFIFTCSRWTFYTCSFFLFCSVVKLTLFTFILLYLSLSLSFV